MTIRKSRPVCIATAESKTAYFLSAALRSAKNQDILQIKLFTFANFEEISKEKKFKKQKDDVSSSSLTFLLFKKRKKSRQKKRNVIVVLLSIFGIIRRKCFVSAFGSGPKFLFEECGQRKAKQNCELSTFLEV